MLRVIFWVLVAANTAVFAYHQDLFGSMPETRREPERLQRQLNAEQIQLLPASAATEPSQPAPSEKEAPQPVACVEIGNFPVSHAKRIEEKLAVLNLGQNQARINVEAANSHMVFLPPSGGKEGAESRVAALKKMGVENYFIMADNATHRWGISLGVFKSEQAARNHKTNLERMGVRGVRIVPRGVSTDTVLYRLRQVDTAAMESLTMIMADFPEQKTRRCEG
jgi:hypothetical protein